MSDIETAMKLARLVKDHGGTAYYVGGCVRDKLMGIKPKDIDIEVHGITPAALEAILDTIGERIEIGESFGIYGIKGCSLDIALPRNERPTGNKHTDFEVTVDPFLGCEKAAMRRDFTINALMENILTGEVIDSFGGISDLEKKILRHVSGKTFPEDPLRVLRCAQFASRFGFTVSEETIDLCKSINLSVLSRERIEGELKKALLKADKPSVFFKVLRAMGQLSVWFPETEALIGIPQHHLYHKEGDVWNHTMMVLDEAAKLRTRACDKYAFMLTALVHDFGKAVCTTEKNGFHHAYGHEAQGIPIIREFLRRITNEKKLIRYVLNLSELHMKPNTLEGANASLKSTNKLFDSVANPDDLILIALADDRGRITDVPSESAEGFLYERLFMYHEIMAQPYVTGKDLINAGFTPNENFTELLAYAHKLRLAGIDKDSAMKQTLSYGRKLNAKK